MDMKNVIKRYNKIMEAIGAEHKTIGTALSEETESFSLKEMVEECEFWYSCYFEKGNVREAMRRSEYDDEVSAWWSESRKLKRFIDKFKPMLA